MIIAALFFLSFVNTIDYLILLFTLQYLCFGHLKLTRRNLLLCAGMVFFSISASQFFFSPEFSGFYLPFILFFVAILAFSSRRITDILRFPLVILQYLAFKTVPTYIIELFFPSTSNTINFWGAELSIVYIITDSVLFIFLCTIHYFISKYQYTFRTSYKEILFSIVFPCYAILLLIIINFIETLTLQYRIFWKIFPPFVYLLGAVYYFYVLFHGQYRIYQETLAHTQYAYLKTQLDALQELKDKEENIHKMRHDLKNHLNLIENLCAQGNYKEVLSYSNKLNNIYSENIPALTGNKIADTIVHTKGKTAKEAGIDFTYEGSLSGLSALSEPDICGLLANAYDNAIEACKTQANAYIHTKANSTQNHTYIEIRNSIPKKIRIRHNQLKTTKPDKQNHGYGIEIMKQTAHKYHGSCNISSTDTEFIVEIMLLTSK